MLKSLGQDDNAVAQRIAQYEAIKNNKGLYIARQIVLSKIICQDILLRKYGLRQHNLIALKKRIDSIETDDLSF